MKTTHALSFYEVFLWVLRHWPAGPWYFGTLVHGLVTLGFGVLGFRVWVVGLGGRG